MKLFTKIALVSAMALSANAMAAQLQALDDAALSATTGQDGITLKINTSGITIDKLLIHDNDGLQTAANGGNVATNIVNPAYTSAQAAVTTAQAAVTAAGGPGADPAADAALAAAQSALVGIPSAIQGQVDLGGTESAGAIILNGVRLNLTGDTIVKLDTDAGTGGTAPFLNIGLQTGTTTQILVDNIAVGASGTYGTPASNRRGATNEVSILESYTGSQGIDITLGQTSMNIQLGNTPQGAMILASGTIAGGVSISNLAIKDNAGGGAIGLDKIRITDENSADLSANARIGVTTAGLKIDGLSAKKDIYIDAVRLGDLSGMASGSTASIGSVEIQGLDMGTSSILVSGH